MNRKEMSEKYKNQSIHYFENALVSMEAGDAEKASEFLWGSLAEAVKAVAASKGKELRHHREIGDYARLLAKETGDEIIAEAYRGANDLHINYYEAGLSLEEVYTYVDRIRTVVGKLLELIPT